MPSEEKGQLKQSLVSVRMSARTCSLGRGANESCLQHVDSLLRVKVLFETLMRHSSKNNIKKHTQRDKCNDNNNNHNQTSSSSSSSRRSRRRSRRRRSSSSSGSSRSSSSSSSSRSSSSSSSNNKVIVRIMLAASYSLKSLGSPQSREAQEAAARPSDSCQRDSRGKLRCVRGFTVLRVFGVLGFLLRAQLQKGFFKGIYDGSIGFSRFRFRAFSQKDLCRHSHRPQCGFKKGLWGLLGFLERDL